MSGSEQLDDMKSRAKTGSLTTDRVILRAIRDELLDPKDIIGWGQSADKESCELLLAIDKVDMKAAEEMRTANDSMMKLKTAAAAAPPGSAGSRKSDSLMDSCKPR